VFAKRVILTPCPSQHLVLLTFADLVSKMGICTFCFAGIPFTFMNSPNCAGVRVECLTVPRIGSSTCRLPFSKWGSKYMVCGWIGGRWQGKQCTDSAIEGQRWWLLTVESEVNEQWHWKAAPIRLLARIRRVVVLMNKINIVQHPRHSPWLSDNTGNMIHILVHK
jgi:hypothetical protein